MRVALVSRLACVLVLSLLIAGCDHKERRNDNPAQESWAALSTTMTNRLSALRDREKILGGRIAVVAAPAGTEDASLAATVVEVQSDLAQVSAAIDKVEAVAKQATADVTAALASKNKIAAERAVTAARTTFEVAAAEAEPAVARVEPKVNLAEQIMKRLVIGIEAEIAQLRRLATAGGNLDFSAIDFRVGGADFDFTHPASKATLERLVQFAATCEQLRFGVTGHTSKEGAAAANQALSLARANAVKAYLIAQGVAADKIVRTAGLGATKPLVDEPDPGTPAETAMAPQTLEGLRRKNRRVNVDVVTPCATAASPPPGAPPPGATPPGATPPGATPPTAPVERVERPLTQPPH